MDHGLRSRGCGVLAMLVVGCLLAGCSSGGSEREQGGLDTSNLVSSLPPAQGEVDTITWNVFGEPESLDPRRSVTYSSGQIVRNLCESLMRMDPEFAISPGLASSHEQVSPTELKLTIREGVTFWDGDPLTAEDVVYSLQRAAADDSVINSSFVGVDSMSATGPMEVTVTFREPDARFLDKLATIAGAVVQKEWAESVGDKVGTSTGGLMCTGPYRLADWRAGSGITIERNDGYWNPELRPLNRQVDFTFVADDTALAQALDAGEIDGSYELPVSTLSKLSSSKSGRVVFGPSTQTSSLFVARPDGPLADHTLRDALRKSIDRDALARVVFNGAAVPNYTHLTPASWPTAERSIYQPDYDEWAEARSYDLDAAKKLVSESSYDGTPLVLAVQAGDQVSGRVAQLFQQQAKAIGVAVEIQSMQPLIFDQAAYDASQRPGVDLLYGASFNSLQDPLETLTFDLLPDQPYNYTLYDNPEVVRLLAQARGEADPKRSAELIVQAQQIYETETAAIPLVSNHEAMFINNRLTGAPTSFAYWSMPQMAYIGEAQ